MDGLPGVEVVMPPVRTCIANGCPDQGKALGAQRNVFLGQLYTMRRGVVPVQIVTLSCRVCSTTYRPNYFIVSPSKQDATRTYYGGMPDAIKATESSFVDQDFARWTRAMMAFSHASGETIARVYNASLTPKEFPHPLAGRTVWHSFYIHALLLDCLRRQRPLLLPHHGPQASRYEAALDDRNAAMVGTGQPMWAHACKECEKLIPPGGDHEPYTRLSACVMDGISIGHARCNVDHCVERLRSPRDRFCPLHDPMHNICAMTGCDLPVTDGMRTCRTPAHRAFETEKRERGKAIFRLKRRLQEVQHAASCEGKPNSRKKQKSAITRRFTHNEQLIVRCCGIIIARATFFEAESMSNVFEFLLQSFPEAWPRAQPSFCFFDNNCSLLKHIRASEELRSRAISDIGLPVDVFHAITKHKETDAFCQVYCNPAGFPELYNTSNQWVFNSSAAEQTNVWFGQFLAVVREMGEVKYNFFLDEMIIIHNEWQESVLAARGALPTLVPREELALPRHTL
ncbi:hypothetical protein C8Q76DRAFT_607919 [Earliella scabrosa]|nr:hypothetical protein C8Q76DRAFT_607919 [Earliella scabrosa]